MNTKEHILKMTDTKLLQEFEVYEHLIGYVECFNSNDVLYLNMVGNELHKRGFGEEHYERTKWVKPEKEDK